MSKLLIDEPPLQLLPGLAQAIKVSPALVLQQLHFRLRISEYQRDGKSWVPRSLEEWVEKDFPFWNMDTVNDIFNKLETRNLIERTALWNNAKTDRTLWYTINYEQVDLLSQEIDQIKQVRAARKAFRGNPEMFLKEDKDQEEEIEEDSDSFSFFSEDSDLPDLPIPPARETTHWSEGLFPPAEPINGQNAHTIWETAYGQLALSMPREAFDTWLRGIVLLHHAGGVFTFDARNQYAQAWLRERLSKVIVRTLSQVAGCPVEVRFVLASDFVESEKTS